MKRVVHKVDDKVVALTNPSHPGNQPRKRGNIYIVNAVSFCSKCGEQRINIGIVTKNSRIRCFSCDGLQDTNGLMWTASKLFAKIEDIQEAIENAVQKEDYETAAILRNIQTKQEV